MQLHKCLRNSYKCTNTVTQNQMFLKFNWRILFKHITFYDIMTIDTNKTVPIFFAF